MGKGGGSQNDQGGPPSKKANPHDNVITAPPGPKSELYNYCAKKLEGGGYGQYKDLKGQWKETGYTVFVDHVQGDAYAPPSSIRVRIPSSETQYPATTNSASQASFVTNSIVN